MKLVYNSKIDKHVEQKMCNNQYKVDMKEKR